MSVLDDLRSLDGNDPGRWPLPIRVAAIVIVFLLVLAGGTYYFVVRGDLPDLRTAEDEELRLKADFETKQQKAASFDAYKQQLEDIEARFGTMLRQLPGQTDIADVLEDVSQTAVAAGLEMLEWKRQEEIPRDFYAEVPVQLSYQGNYHAMAKFASDIAALPRIVTLHEIAITPIDPDTYDNLRLDVTAKTYKYLEEAPATP